MTEEPKVDKGLYQRVDALGERINLLESEISSVRAELAAKIDAQAEQSYERIIELERERVRLATILDGLQTRIEELSRRPSFESGFQAKVSQFALFVAAAAVGAVVVRVVERLAP